VVSNNIVAKAHNKLVICLLNTFSRSRLLTTLPQPALKPDYAVSRIECVAELSPSHSEVNLLNYLKLLKTCPGGMFSIIGYDTGV